jgi:hypothetical protein
MPIDYKKYHPKWSLIRLLILKRADNNCEGSPKYPDCRAANGSINKNTGSKIVLTIAHMDHNRDNNRFENLKALCQRCHLVHDAKQHHYSRKYGRETKRVNGKLF